MYRIKGNYLEHASKPCQENFLKHIELLTTRSNGGFRCVTLTTCLPDIDANRIPWWRLLEVGAGREHKRWFKEHAQDYRARTRETIRLGANKKKIIKIGCGVLALLVLFCFQMKERKNNNNNNNN